DVVDRLDQAAAHRVAPEAVDDVAREERIGRRRDPFAELDAAIDRVIHWFAVEWPGLDEAAFARMCLLARRFQVHDLLAAEDAELLTVLGAEPNEERGHTVIIVLAPLFDRLMMALCAADADAQEH